MANIAVSSSSLRVIVVYAPNDQTERVCFCLRLRPFLVESLHLVLTGDLNDVLCPKLNKGGELAEWRAIVSWVI